MKEFIELSVESGTVHDEYHNLPKRTRRKTGRVHQFSTRINRATYEAIYEYADREEITLGETIERAMFR